MNYSKNVVVFTLVFTAVLFLYSVLAEVYPSVADHFSNISILSDIVVKAKAVPASVAQHHVADTGFAVRDSAGVLDTSMVLQRSLTNYSQAQKITAFYDDSSKAALPAIMHKLHLYKKTRKGKIRIAWLGDSMIEGDLLTQTFRKKIQQLFGGAGVGFVPCTSVTAPFRTTARHSWKGNWTEENFKTKELTNPIFLSGHLFYSTNASVHVTDASFKDTTQPLEKVLICGPLFEATAVTVNGTSVSINPTKKVNRIVLDSSRSHTIDLGVSNAKLPVYGVSLEPQDGVVVDNFSFRGITGIELGKMDTAFLRAVQSEDTYDLVVLEYGANLMFRPEDSDYSWFQKHVIPVFKRLHEAMPNAEFLLISTADRAFKYGDSWHTAKGIDNLLKSQAEVAFGTGMDFFNMYQSMGGAGTIVRWADSLSPAMANKDYIHPNQRGAEVLGNIVFDAFMADFQKNEVIEVQRDNYTVTAARTIIDKATQLEWVLADDKDYNWQEANDWVRGLTVQHAKWALPTPEQLLTLYNSNYEAGTGYVADGIRKKAKISNVFTGIGKGTFAWTSKETSPEKAVTINLNLGVPIATKKSAPDLPVRVLAVRKNNS